MRKISDQLKWVAVAAIFAVCVAPTFISYRPYVFRWDDSEYLQRSIAVSRAFWTLNVHGMGAGMVSKRPPAMTLLGLPWGQLASWEAAGKCFITLGAVISLLSSFCLYLLLRIGVRPSLLALASICVLASLGPYPSGASTHFQATAFMADSLFAWTTLATVLLIPYEARLHCSGINGAILRGILWAAVLSLGVMTKIGFFYFVVLVVPILFLVRLRWVGLPGALAALIALACCSAPAAFYLLRWGQSAFANGGASSFGRVADFYYSGTLAHFLGDSIRESPGLAVSFLLMASALVYLLIKKRISIAGPHSLAPLIIIGFGILVFASPNRQMRYAFPAVVSLPFLIGILLSPNADSVPGKSAALAAGLVFCGLFVACVPTWHRTDRQNLSRCEAVLAQALKCHSRRVVLATDSPTLNKNLMDLANEFWATESPVEVDTLAYQAMSGVPIEADFHAIDEFDQVVFQDRAELSPPFTNQRVSEYERYIQQGRYVPVKVADDLTVYSIRCGP